MATVATMEIMDTGGRKHVVIVLRRAATEAATAQGLRAAAAYVSFGLGVTVVLCGPAREVLAHAGAEVLPALHTLRWLGHAVLCEDDCDLAQEVRCADAVVIW